MDRPIPSVEDLGRISNDVLTEVERAIVGKRAVLELIWLAMLANGHVLIEDVPGLAKTLIARSLAAVTSLGFNRIQFTPDLMPSDVTGSLTYNARTNEFDFRRGPIFTNILLGDEINRAPAKTQAALLEAMQEQQVTVEGTTWMLDSPFVVIATQNPIEFEGTYPLPEAQLDRFLIRTSVGYPSADDEWTILRDRQMRQSDEVRLVPKIDGPGLLALQAAVEQVHIDEGIGRYMVEIVAATRMSRRVQVGASPRGSLALLKLARGKAALAGRGYVIPDDVKAVAVPALGHRLVLRPEFWVQRISVDDVVREVLDIVPTPPTIA